MRSSSVRRWQKSLRSYRDPDRGEGTEVTSTVVGVFRSGLKRVDEGQIYSLLGFAQVMMGRSGIINELRLRLDDPLIAQKVATQVEALTGYKSVPWQEANSYLCRASRFAISSC
jgi:lipoprotein-releasing system permease protein